MLEKTDLKRVWIFLGFAFGISWGTGLVIFLTGGLQNSPVLTIEGTSFSLAYLLLATAYMFSPALANILTRWITREGKTNLMLEPHFDRKRWVYWLCAWVLPGLLTLVGLVIFFLVFPQHFDSKLSLLTSQMAAQGTQTPLSPWLIVILQVIQALLLSPLLNAISTFGEEFGWRGYLLPKLLPLGHRKAVLLTGVIWGVWHWPIILMGYNYGLDYFGAPVLGPLAMVWFTLSLGVLFSWVTLKAENVWPAVIAHGTLNGIAGLGIYFIIGEPSTLLGPAPTGLVGGLGFTLAALILLILPGALTKEIQPNSQQR